MLLRIIALLLLGFCLLMIAFALLNWAHDIQASRAPAQHASRRDAPMLYVMVAASRNPRAHFEDYTRGER